jgi:hypothetical protein
MPQPHPSPRRRVVVLSSGGDLVRRVLATLAERGTPPDAVVVYSPSALAQWRGLPTPSARALRLPLVPLRWAVRRLRPRLSPRLRRGGAPLVVTGPLNSARMLRDLRGLRPDVVVLAGCGLVSAEVLAVPALGVVSVHPGLLPWTRGSSPLLHSLRRGVALGATAFRVDPGIDSGCLLARRLLPISGGETLGELRAALLELWVEMTAELVAAACAEGLPPGTPQALRFPLCRRVPAAMTAVADPARALELFEKWRPFCAPGGLSLPSPEGDALLPEVTVDGDPEAVPSRAAEP